MARLVYDNERAIIFTGWCIGGEGTMQIVALRMVAVACREAEDVSVGRQSWHQSNLVLRKGCGHIGCGGAVLCIWLFYVRL